MIRTATTLACALLILCGLAATAAAHFSSTRAASTSVASHDVAALASAQATTTDACATVLVEWPTATGADTFDVEVQRNGGAWQVLASDVGTTYSVTDTAAGGTTSAAYRVTPRHRSSGWSDAAATTQTLTCFDAAA